MTIPKNFKIPRDLDTLIIDLSEHDREIYNKAIDELIDKVSESILWDILAEIMKRNIGASKGSDMIIDYLQKIAEQLKGDKK